jgi:ankyrin repeat protein
MLRKNITWAVSLSLVGALTLTLVLLGAPADTRVADAAMMRDVDAVHALIRQAVDVNSAQGDGMTALHWAAYNGDSELAQTLLYAGANTRATTRLGGYTPLYMASKSGHADIVDVLLKAGADPDTEATGGITPLMMAASAGDATSVRLLTEAGADVNATETERGQTALAFAAAFDRPEAIRALADAGADINKASKQIEPPPPRNRPGQNFTFGQGRGRGGQAGQAGRGGRGRGQAAQAQEEAAKKPDEEEKSDEAKKDEKPELSTEKGRNPKGKLTPLMYASRDGAYEAVRALVDLGADLDSVNGDNSTALLLSTINGNLDIAEYLVESGADVTIASDDGATPLYGALRIQWTLRTNRPQPTTFYEKTQYLDLMKLMLEKGADPNARLRKNLWYIGYNFALERNNSSGTTPFWKAAAVGDVDGMRLLVEHGADPTIPSIEGITPLLIASGAGFHGNDSVTTPLGRMPAVRYLVAELGADVNAADTGAPEDPNAAGNQFRRRGPRGGRTALHNAAGRGDNEMILYLVSQGARLDAVAKNGQTIADMANGSRQRVQPYQETLALLDMLGARNNHKCISC